MDLHIVQAKQVLRAARELRERVQQNLATRHFPNDDLHMNAYNDLTQQAANLFPADPVLNGKMVKMPDAVVQSFGTLSPISALPPMLPSERLMERLTQFINRLEFVLGEPEAPERPARDPGDLLRHEEAVETRQILNELEALRQNKPQLKEVDQRGFAFVSDEYLRQVLKLDFVEAQQAFASGAYKACALLAGGIIEGMLLDALQSSKVRDDPNFREATTKFPLVGQDINWDKVSMTNLIEAACKLHLLSESAVRLVPGARDFRNTVHPRAEVREGMRAGLEEAELLLALVKLIYRDLDSAHQQRT